MGIENGGMSEEEFNAMKEKQPTSESKKRALDLIQKTGEIDNSTHAESFVANKPESESSNIFIGKDGTIYRDDAAKQQRQKEEAEEINNLREKIANDGQEK